MVYQEQSWYIAGICGAIESFSPEWRGPYVISENLVKWQVRDIECRWQSAFCTHPNHPQTSIIANLYPSSLDLIESRGTPLVIPPHRQERSRKKDNKDRDSRT